MADAAPTSPNQPAPDGSGVFNPQAGFLNAEAKRTLSSPSYSSTAPSSIDIPKDTVIKSMMLKMTMVVTVTYSSGSPLYSQFGFFEKICSNVEVNIGAGRVVKSVRPHFARLNNIILGSECPRRAYLDTSGAPTTSRAAYEWIAGTLAYPSSTHYTTAQEAFILSFENPWGYGGSRHMSELDVRDVSSAILKFYWQNATNLLNEGNAASVTYTNLAVTVNPVITENRARPRPTDGQVLFDYVESSTSKSFSAAARSQQLPLNTGAFLMGVGVLCVNGDSVYTFKENLLTNLTLKINGSSSIQGPVSHQDLQDINVLRHGVDDKLGYAAHLATIATDADKHSLRGFAHMNLIRNGDWQTAINTSRQAGVDACNLEFDTPGTTGTDPADYTNPLQVIAHTHEIRPYVYKR